jgi:hypothetical protein
MQSASPDPAPETLAALARVLKPLARVAMRFQLSLQTLLELLKRVMVEEAVRSIAADGGQATDSRVHLLTGVHRKDIRRFRTMESGARSSYSAEESTAAQLIARWLGDKRFSDGRGGARDLVLRRDGPTDPASFEELVAEISRGDVRPRAVLDEMLRLGVVSMAGERAVRLNRDAFVPTEDARQKLYYLGLNVGDHAAAAAHNIAGGAPSMLERSVHYDGLSLESIHEMERMARTEGMRLLHRLNRKAFALQQRDLRKKSGATWRFNFGIYSYRGDAHEEG